MATKPIDDLLSKKTEIRQIVVETTKMADYDEMRPAKRVKLADENNLEDNSIQSFRGFQFIKVLNENARDKTVAVHGGSISFTIHANLPAGSSVALNVSSNIVLTFSLCVG